MNRLLFGTFFFFIFTVMNLIGYSQSATDFLSINYSVISKSEFKDEVGEAQLSHFDFNFVTPTIQLNSKTKINNIIYYRLSNYQYNSFSNSIETLPQELHEIKYTLLTRHKFNSKWELLLVPRISIRSDFKDNLNSNDLFPAVSTIVMKTSQKNEHLKWGFGLNYNNDLEKNSIIPILAFSYVADKMKLTTYFPNNANLIFLPSKKIEYGFGFTTDPTLFHINTIDSIDYLRTLNVAVHPTFSYNLSSNFWLNAKGGWVLRRNFDFYNSDFESPTDDFENQLKASAFVQIGVSFRTK